MPEDLLLELEPPAPVVESLEDIEHLVPVVMRQVGWAVEGMKGSALLFENAWRRIVLAVARGQTTEMHAMRVRLMGALEKRLSLLKDTHAMANWFATSRRAAVPNPDVLLPEIAGLERLKGRVFDHWQTTDDLEDLAARDYSLTTADLDRLGPQRPPPASYYAAESKPF